MDYLIVYTPSHFYSHLYPNKRFLVSFRQLKKYIGVRNSNKAIYRANTQKTNKSTLKFRKYGKIEIYLK